MRIASTVTKAVTILGLAGGIGVATFGSAGAVKAPQSSCSSAQAQLQSDEQALAALFQPARQMAESADPTSTKVAEVEQAAEGAGLSRVLVREVVADVEVIVKDEGAVLAACAPAPAGRGGGGGARF
jgi:hypothetical protein